MEPEAALAICRFAHDASTMLLWGTFGYLAALVPRDLALATMRRLTAFRTSAIALAVLTMAAALPIEVASIGNGWPDAVDPATVRAVLFETSVGPAWLTQAAAALLLAATLALPTRRQAGGTALASGLLLAALALTGHAAMHEGALGAAHRLNDAVHVLAGGAWVGALVPLVLLLRGVEGRPGDQGADIALRRFSRAGHVAVAVVLMTGVVNTMLVLGRWPTAWSSPYQAMLAAKIALVAVMAVLALVNRYMLVPMMARAPGDALRALGRATVAEIVLGIAVIGLVSGFGLLEPA